jgi:hypothetical protein
MIRLAAPICLRGTGCFGSGFGWPASLPPQMGHFPVVFAGFGIRENQVSQPGHIKPVRMAGTSLNSAACSYLYNKNSANPLALILALSTKGTKAHEGNESLSSALHAIIPFVPLCVFRGSL